VQQPSVRLRAHHDTARAPRSPVIDHETTPREEMDTAENFAFDAEMFGGDEEPLTNDDRSCLRRNWRPRCHRCPG